MPSHRAVLLVAVLAACAGAVASLHVEPRLAQRLAATGIGQWALQATLQAKAPAPPTGLKIAERDAIVPTMTLATAAGQPLEIPRAWAGRTTLVNVWASWCGPCLKEMPDLQAFAGEQAANGVHVVGIALDDAAAVRTFIARHGIRYPILIDTPGPADAGVRLGNPAGVLPYSLLIDADGRLRKTRIGPFADATEISSWARLP